MKLENQRKWIVFYGYNSETERKVQEMENSDYKVKYIIDKQADKIGIYRGIPIIKEENILKNTDFYSYKKIASTFGSGKLREMGVFYKKKK